MIRVPLYIFAATALTVWAVYKRHTSNLQRRIPAKKAAAMLQEAWSDYHTRA